jgi:GDP-L-fucose synthase
MNNRPLALDTLPYPPAMPLDARIYVAGHRGLVGSALQRVLQSQGYRQLITRRHAELELTEQAAVRAFFEAERPEYVFLAAAKVGGIYANHTYPATFIYQNLALQTHIMRRPIRPGSSAFIFGLFLYLSP